MAVILSFLSDYRPSKETDYFLPSGETINGISTIKGTYTNEAPVKYLFEKAKSNNSDEKIKIIFIVSKKVDDEMVFNDDFSIVEKNENSEYTGTKNMIDYYRNIIKDVEVEYICYDFIKDLVIENSKEIANNLYRNISEKTKGERSIYIDYTGGFRDTSYLMVSLIQYLKIVGVDCKCIVYSNFQNKTIYKINYIYRINEILQGANDFIATGSITHLKNYFDKGLADRDPNDVDIEKLTQINQILNNIDDFTKAISLGQISKLDKFKNAVGDSLYAYSPENSTKISSLSTNIFSLLLPIIKKSLHIDKALLDYPEIVEWCVDHGYIQQAFTIYVEKMPIIYLDAGINSLDLLSVSNQSAIVEDSEKFYTVFWDSLPSTAEDALAKKISEEFKRPNEKGYLAPSYEYFCDYDIDNSVRFTKEEQAKLKKFKRALDFYIPSRGFDYLGFKRERDTATSIGRAKNSLFNEMVTNSKKLSYYLFDRGREFEELEAHNKELSSTDKKNLTYQKKMKVAQRLKDLENLKSVMLLYLGVKIMRNHMNHAADTGSDTPTQIAKEILQSEHILTSNNTDADDIFNYDNAVELIKKGIQLTKDIRDNNELLITQSKYTEIKI